MSPRSEDIPSEQSTGSITENDKAPEETDHVVPPEHPKTKLEDKPIGGNNANNNNNDALQRWQLRVHGAAVFIAFLAFLAAAYYARIAYKQWAVMNQTYGEIQKQTVSAKESADAAKSAADTAKAVIDLSRTDQRAWVGTVDNVPAAFKDASNNPVYIKEGVPVKLGVIIANSGKSPALNVKTNIRPNILPAHVRFYPDYGGTPESFSSSTLQPQARATLFTTPSQPLTASDIDAIKSGKWVLYVFGKIT